MGLADILGKKPKDENLDPLAEGGNGKEPDKPEQVEVADGATVDSYIKRRNAALKTFVGYFDNLSQQEYAALPLEVTDALASISRKTGGASNSLYRKMFPNPQKGQTFSANQLFELFDGNKSVKDACRFYKKQRDRGMEDVSYDPTLRVFTIEKV